MNKNDGIIKILPYSEQYLSNFSSSSSLPSLPLITNGSSNLLVSQISNTNNSNINSSSNINVSNITPLLNNLLSESSVGNSLQITFSIPFTNSILED